MTAGSPTPEAIRFPVRGMTCVSCVGRITRAIRAVPGVTGVDVDLRTETATVRREPVSVSDAALAAAVARAGYEADIDASIIVSLPHARGLLDRLLRR